MRLGIWATILAFSLDIFGQQSTPHIPHEYEDFYKKLNQRLGDLESGLSSNQEMTSISDKFVKTVLSNLLKKEIDRKKVFSEIGASQELKSKILKLQEEMNQGNENTNPKDKDKTEVSDKDSKASGGEKKEETKKTNEITFENLEKLLEKHSSKFSDDEKLQLAALMLAHVEKNMTQDDSVKASTEKAIESLVRKYQKDIVLKDLPKSEKRGLALLTELLSKALANPEVLGSAFTPIREQIFESERNGLTKSQQSQLPTFDEVMNNLKELGGGAEIPRSTPNGLALSPFSGGGVGGGSCHSRGGFGVDPKTIPLGTFSRLPDSEDSEELRACVQDIRKKRFNVELQLPGALCASTPIAKDPKKELEDFKTRKNRGGVCQVLLGTARHCLEGIGSLSGQSIGAHVGGRNVGVRVVQVGSADSSSGPSVQDGNPDLLVMTVEMECDQAAQLEVARVPTPEEIKVMFGKNSVPVVMQQNSTINALADGENKATIAATGAFDKRVDGQMGNYIRFNSNSSFNGTSGQDVGHLTASPGVVLNSDRIKSGDSGGAGLTCKLKDGKVDEVLYVGAISHITVRGDKQEGKEGGIASGQSLLNLSRRFYGDERALASRSNSGKQKNRQEHDNDI